MVFCGQCGLQLAPGTVRCPRCGTFADVDTSGATIEAANADDPTVTHPAYNTPSRPNTGLQGSLVDQPPLILRDSTGTAYDPHTEEGYGSPTREAKPGYGAYPPKVTSPGMTQGNSGYPAQGASYADFHTSHAAGYPATSGTYQPLQPTPAPAHHTKGRTASLLLILFGILLILGAMVLFALRLNVFSGTTSNGNNAGGNPGSVGSVTVSVTVTPASPAQQAQAVVEHYYTDVNNHDYQAAYALWNQYPDSLATFEQGYAHTQHVTLSIGKVVALSDGTEQVFVTLNAKEDNASGQGSHYSLYKGYYIVGPVNATWLILKGQLARA